MTWWARFALPTRRHAPTILARLPAPAGCRYRETRCGPSTGTSATASACLAIRCRAPTSPSSVISSLKKRRDHSTGLPRRPSLTGTAIRWPRSGAKVSISRSISLPIDQRHVAEADDRAVGIFGHRRNAGLDGGRQPAGEIRIADEFHLRARQAPARPDRPDAR